QKLGDPPRSNTIVQNYDEGGTISSELRVIETNLLEIEEIKEETIGMAIGGQTEMGLTLPGGLAANFKGSGTVTLGKGMSPIQSYLANLDLRKGKSILIAGPIGFSPTANIQYRWASEIDENGKTAIRLKDIHAGGGIVLGLGNSAFIECSGNWHKIAETGEKDYVFSGTLIVPTKKLKILGVDMEETRAGITINGEPVANFVQKVGIGKNWQSSMRLDYNIENKTFGAGLNVTYYFYRNKGEKNE
ncbi:MAG: hypothetical protein WC356_05675, partial [Candidatus Micrarchaeia archaeon]